MSLKYYEDAHSSSFECSCQHGVKNGHIAACWVGECCRELGTSSTIHKSGTKECFVGMLYECC